MDLRSTKLGGTVRAIKKTIHNEYGTSPGWNYREQPFLPEAEERFLATNLLYDLAGSCTVLLCQKFDCESSPFTAMLSTPMTAIQRDMIWRIRFFMAEKLGGEKEKVEVGRVEGVNASS